MPRRLDRNLWIWLAPVALTLVLFGVLILVLSANAAPITTTNTITVTNTNDSGAGSLRQAIADAASGDAIAFSAALSGGTIVLAAPLTITKDLTIDGAGLADPIRISGSNARRVFYIPSGNVTMAHLVVQEGHAAGTTDCTTVSNGGSCGGGIYAANPLILNHMTVLSNTAAGTDTYPGAGGALYLGSGGTLVDVFAQGNSALGFFAGDGGGIASFGPLTVVNSTITDNWAEGIDMGGGGIFVSGASVIISGTTLSNNRSTSDDGGGITMDHSTRDAITVTNSIIQGNYAADDGGGLKLDNTVARLENTQIVSNEAAVDGGAMHIDYEAAVTLVADTLTGNRAGDEGGAIFKQDSEGIVISNTQFISNTAINRGGSLYNQTGSSVAISVSAFISNTAGAAGGAINNNIATMTVDHSLFTLNTSLDADGGAIANNGNGTLIVSNSTFTGNAAPALGCDGGAIYNDDAIMNTLIVDGSTFNGNRAYEGGAVRSRDILILTNSTFYDNAVTNASGGGGALRLMGTANVTNTTIFSNSAPGNAGGVRISSNTGDFSFANVIVTGNSGGQCSTAGGVLGGVGNLATDATCGASFAQVSDGLLGALGNYGGATQTAPLLPGSPAINAGDNPACLLRDQRGVARPQGSACDVGAFESQGFVLNKAGGDNQATVIGQPFALPLVITVTSQSWQGFVEAVNGGMIAFSAPIAGASVTFAPTTTQPIVAGSVVLPITANTTPGSFNVPAAAAGAVTQTFSLTTAEGPPPQARADVAAVLQDTPLLIDVLANDIPGANPQLAVSSVTQPPAGGVTTIEQNQVRFTPAAGFTGLVAFTSTIQDAKGLASSAPVAVRVTAINTTGGVPQVLSLPDPAVDGGGTFTTPAGTTETQIPAGAITGTGNPLTTYDLVYQELNTPEPPPPGTLFSFGGRAFVLQLFIDAQLQTPYAFNVPIVVTISYDPAAVPDPSKLVLYTYDEGRQEWTKEGITFLGVDTQKHTFQASIGHLSEFAVGLAAPTGIDPGIEPQLVPQLFMPQVYR